MKYFPIFLFSLVTFFSSCSSTKNLESGLEKAILFGNGGGFTGQVIEYVLDEHGTFMRNDKLTSEVTILTSLKKSEIKKLFKELDAMHFDTINFKHPGNTYYFIKSTNSTGTHEVVWGNPDNMPPAEVLQLYDLLLSKTK
jgi:hypothetical protein